MTTSQDDQHEQRILVIGEAPSPTDREGVPFGGGRTGTGLRLAKLAGINPEHFLYYFEPRYLFDRYSPQWSEHAARKSARSIQIAGRTVLCCGRKVAMAFGLRNAPNYTPHHVRSATIYCVPHPSGINRALNSSDERYRMSSCLQELISRIQLPDNITEGPPQSEKHHTKYLSYEAIDRIWRAYLEVQDGKMVAARTGHGIQIVQRLIFQGDPLRGVAPFRERLAAIIRLAAEMEDYELAKVRANVGRVAKQMFAALARRVDEIAKDPTALREIGPKELPILVERLGRFLLYIYGEPEHRVEVGLSEPTLDRLRDLVPMMDPLERRQLVEVLRDDNAPDEILDAVANAS